LRIILERQCFDVILEKARAQLDALTVDHDLVTDVEPTLPPVMADPQRIAQVLTNLVNNAAKYSPPDTRIVISARVEGDALQIDVIDEGPGIPPNERARAFEAFHRLGSPLAQEAKGVGLGLAICKGLIAAHGGRIWIEDKPAPGTTVCFTLPLAAPLKGSSTD
jgi:two-component system, OmpR family, sensor histidine kinase KdpD